MFLEVLLGWPRGPFHPAERLLDEVRPALEFSEELFADCHKLHREAITRTIHWLMRSTSRKYLVLCL